MAEISKSHVDRQLFAVATQRGAFSTILPSRYHPPGMSVGGLDSGSKGHVCDLAITAAGAAPHNSSQVRRASRFVVLEVPDRRCRPSANRRRCAATSLLATWSMNSQPGRCAIDAEKVERPRSGRGTLPTKASTAKHPIAARWVYPLWTAPKSESVYFYVVTEDRELERLLNAERLASERYDGFGAIRATSNR